MKTVIVIPARYASVRLPGKPLMMIRGQTLLERVVKLALEAIKGIQDASVVVATDDERIAAHCRVLGVDYVMTSSSLPTGTDRVADAVKQLATAPDFILNMQGDAPFTPPDFLSVLIESFRNASCEVITPVSQLTWEELDQFRQNKKTTPFSGTTALFDKTTGRAFWFSKQILPAIRIEDELRKRSHKSPVFRHIGLYGYSRAMLEEYVKLSETPFERLEGLEQLRLLENDYTIRCVPVDFQGRVNMSGIDSLEDIQRAEALIDEHGEWLK